MNMSMRIKGGIYVGIPESLDGLLYGLASHLLDCEATQEFLFTKSKDLEIVPLDRNYVKLHDNNAFKLLVGNNPHFYRATMRIDGKRYPEHKISYAARLYLKKHSIDLIYQGMISKALMCGKILEEDLSYDEFDRLYKTPPSSRYITCHESDIKIIRRWYWQSEHFGRSLKELRESLDDTVSATCEEIAKKIFSYKTFIGNPLF